MAVCISEFQFDASALNVNERVDYVAHLGAGIKTRDGLFDALRQELGFPSYFGANWDALSDCLRDLSWLPQRRVILLHADLPPIDRDDAAVYLDVLSECIKDWQRDDTHQLVVVFPESARPAISSLTERHPSDEGG